jgi:hypothetical protein
MTRADRVHSTPQMTASKTNPPDQPMTRDEELGIAWWNSLTKQERAKWSAIAGNTGRPKDAWEAFKRGSVDQTPPVDQTRRRFLTVAAGASVASVGTLAAAGIPTSDDPAFALIAAQRAAEIAHGDAIDAQDEAEDKYGLRSDEAWEAADRCGAMADEVNAICWKLATMPPTTLAGVAALASPAFGGCSFFRDGRAERHSAVPRIPRSHSSASLRSRSALALSSAARASLRYRIARALLMASQIPTQQNEA